MKKFIKNTANSIRTKAIRLAATRRSGEGYIDTAVKILIAVVLGALLLVLLAMFLTASTVQNIYIIVAGMVVIAAGELVRLLRLPKDITAHLTDTGLRER